MYAITIAASAKRRLKKFRKSGTFDDVKFTQALAHLRKGVPLPDSFKDHALKGAMEHLRECHLAFNVLLIYRRNETFGVITIADVGTHDELFG